MQRLRGDEPVSELAALRAMRAPAILDRTALLQFVARFQSGRVGEQELESLAELLEGEPIIYEEGHEGAIADVLFWLSSPEINGPITTTLIRECIARLGGAD